MLDICQKVSARGGEVVTAGNPARSPRALSQEQAKGQDARVAGAGWVCTRCVSGKDRTEWERRDFRKRSLYGIPYQQLGIRTG